MDWLVKLYDEEKGVMLLIANSLVRDFSQSEDIVHSAMVQLARLKSKPNIPRLYAFRVVRNLAIDHLRSNRLLTLLDCSEIDEDMLAFDEVQTCNIDNENFADEAVEKALVKLRQIYREVIEMHLKAELSFREIAELTETPLPTVASRYRRGIAQLRVSLKVQDG